ncbi:MAG: hypothetical protein Q9176_002981 [Flavoplaca citrina]
MPGVPSGRGCDACRKQKKKCDIDTYPCSRCRRLSIPCIGHGQQRYKFKNETVVLTVAKRVTSTSYSSDQPRSPVPGSSSIISNPSSRLLTAFIHTISQQVDIRFQLPWNFGDYFNLIPRHLGVSRSLDTAVDALITAHTSFCAGNLQPGPEVLAKHSLALSVLRHNLTDVVKARTSETLAAIMVISVTQVRHTTQNSGNITHTQGAARLLTSRGLAEPRDEFGKRLVLTLRGPVVFEALLTNNIQLSTREWKILSEGTFGGHDNAPDVKWFMCITDVPDLIQRSKAALILHEPPSLHLLSLELEVRALLDHIRPVITRLRDRFDNFDAKSFPEKLSDQLRAHYMRSLAMGLGVGIVLNCVLSGLEGTPTVVCDESVLWSDEIVRIAELAVVYRPLGSMAMLIALRMAWSGVWLRESKARIEELLKEYGLSVGLTEDSDCSDLGPMQRRWTLQQL